MKTNLIIPEKVIMKVFTHIYIPLILLITTSCKLIDSPIEPEPTVPTSDVRYVVTMTSSSTNSNPQIIYTNELGGTTQVTNLNLDITVAIDSGTTVNLSASCVGYYSPASGSASAGIEMQLFIDDTLAADTAIIETDNLAAVTATASVSALVK